MSKRSFFASAAAIAAAVLAVGFAASAFAQSPSDNMAECQRLYGQWSKYNGTSAYSPNAAANTAMEECRKGNYSAGIADLRQVLQHNGIPVPPSETATAPRK